MNTTEKANHLPSMGWRAFQPKSSASSSYVICRSFRNHSSVNTNDKVRIILHTLEIHVWKVFDKSKQSNNIRVKLSTNLQRKNMNFIASLAKLENYFFSTHSHCNRNCLNEAIISVSWEWDFFFNSWIFRNVLFSSMTRLDICYRYVREEEEEDEKRKSPIGQWLWIFPAHVLFLSKMVWNRFRLRLRCGLYICRGVP